MEFTYASYLERIQLFQNEDYHFSFFGKLVSEKKSVIIRHDVDFNVTKAYELSKLEKDHGVCSTYFLLLRSHFYNILNTDNVKLIHKMAEMGHRIGLHFDASQYAVNSCEELVEKAEKEKDLLQKAIGKNIPIETVSMHVPTPEILAANIVFPTMENTYSQHYFKNFMYVSDSRMLWCENVKEVVTSGKFPNIQLLTHPIWYSENKETKEKILENLLWDVNHRLMNNLNRQFHLGEFSFSFAMRGGTDHDYEY